MDLDLSPRDEPDPGQPLRQLLEDWLAYQRHSFRRKLRGLDPAGAATHAVPPVELSVLGLVRHMTQMEHVFLAWGLGGGTRAMVYGDDDFAGGSAATYDGDLAAYETEVARADEAIAALADLDAPGHGHGWPLGATLVKMISEYALHTGQAHMLRYATLGEIVR